MDQKFNQDQIINIDNSKKVEEEKNKPINEKMRIHSMPKKYIKAEANEKKAQSFGVIILVVGTILMVVLAVVFYFIYFGQEEKIIEDTVTTGDVIEKNQDKKDTPLKDEKEEKKQEEEDEQADDDLLLGDTDSEEGGDQSTTSLAQEEGEDLATSTDLSMATSTLEGVSSTTEESQVMIIMDSDSDGLSDIEEAIIGSDLNLKDSDKDGYDDSSELLGLYNPAGNDKLADNSNIDQYENELYKYNVLYPSIWPIDNLLGDDSVMFKLDNSQFVQIIIMKNDNNATIEEWYKDSFGVSEIDQELVIEKEGWAGIKSPDNLTAYLTKSGNDNIFVVSYNLGNSERRDYYNIFEMMISSLEINE